MAVRMSTARRMDRNRADGIVTRGEKSKAKRAARANREARMVAAIKSGTFPYTPAVQSWISVKLGKPFRQVTEADAKKLAG